MMDLGEDSLWVDPSIWQASAGVGSPCEKGSGTDRYPPNLVDAGGPV